MVKPFQPTEFGRYLLADRIAIGGMAEIFYAKVFGAMGFEKAVVIKRILPQFAEDTDFLRMFITEAKLVCHLEHPNIVQVHQLEEIDGQYFISMEFVNGIDARQLWRTLAKRRQRLPGVLALFIVAEFLKGLDFAHRAVGPDGKLLGVVHRDVSPSNLLISFRGDVKIGDFGIALVQQESKTQAGVLKGKFGYMSPEQVAGLAVDHRSDIFAAGIVLAELLLGRRLFLGSSDFETLDKVMNVRLDVLEEHESALPPEAVRIVQQALLRDVNDRYQSAREFYEDITEYLYQEGHRITNETLAAFMAEHVTPYLPQSTEAAPSTEPSGTGSQSASVGRSTSGILRSPVVSSNIIPDAEELDSSSRHDSFPDYDSVDAPPQASIPDTPTPAKPMQMPRMSITEEEPRPDIPSSVGLDMDEEPDDELLGEDPMDAPDEPAHSGGSEVPLDHPAFGSMPLIEIDGFVDEDGNKAPMSSEVLAPESTGVVSASELSDGAGEELDLWDVDEEEEFFVAPDDINKLVASSASVLVEGQLDEAEKRDMGTEPDFTGDLASRTVTKVLFRFSIVGESGLLVLTGPAPAGEQADILDWLLSIQFRSGATPTSTPSDTRTCEIHLTEGQPHLASADRSEEALVAHLIRVDVLSRHRVEMALRNNPHRRPISALLAAAALAPLQVSRHVTSFVLETVLETFSWTSGEFSFYRDQEFSEESFPTGLGAIEMMSKGIENFDAEFLDSYFQKLSSHNIVANRTPPASIERFEPSKVQMDIYRTLGTARTIEDALQTCSSMGDELKARQSLYMFIECELASLV